VFLPEFSQIWLVVRLWRVQLGYLFRLRRKRYPLELEDNMPSRSDRPSADLNAGLSQYFKPLITTFSLMTFFSRECCLRVQEDIFSALGGKDILIEPTTSGQLADAQHLINECFNFPWLIHLQFIVSFS